MDTEIQANQGVLRELFESVKPLIWIVKAIGIFQGQMLSSYSTAFAINKKGYLLTCTHSWLRLQPRLFRVRLLGDTADTDTDDDDDDHAFKIEAKLVAMNEKGDMGLLEVPFELDDTECGKFGPGSLAVGETIISMGNPHEFVGSGMTGYVVYPCIGADEDYDYNDTQTCENYKCTSLDNMPKYRIMGNVWNADYFNRNEIEGEFEKNLQAKLPIIQAAGLVGGEGSSGAPIFNLQGRIVGMFVLGYVGYDIGIHVTALKKFLVKYRVLPDEGVKEESQDNAV